MKAVLMSFSHEECEKIFSGEKINKVMKTAPKLKPPFKVYVYETIGKRTSCRRCVIWQSWLDCPMRSPFGCTEGTGAVVGEFVCDQVDWFIVGSFYCDTVEALSCMSYEEVIDYFYKPEELDGNTPKEGKTLHITEPKLYDIPKELNEFSKYGYKRIECVESGCGNEQCRYCDPAEVIAGLYKPPMCIKGNCIVTRPPRSWCYVEEIEE